MSGPVTAGPITREQEQATLDRLRQMKEQAEQEESPTKKCVEGEFMLFVEWERALMPGHIYSESGIAEARISGSCEYHFDKWFATDEDANVWDKATQTAVGPIHGAQ